MTIEVAQRATGSPLPEQPLVELRRHLDHLKELRPRVTSAEALRRDLTLHNNVLYSLLAVCQLLIDIAGDLASRRGQRFVDYTEAVRSLTAYPEFPSRLVRDLEPFPGLRRTRKAGLKRRHHGTTTFSQALVRSGDSSGDRRRPVSPFHPASPRGRR